MPRYPGAVWRPITGHTDGPMRSHRGLVLHVNQSNGNLFNHVSGDHNVSCHFEVYKTGVIEQYLDTNMSSWCQSDGNMDWMSCETEGFDTEPLTQQQIVAIAGLYVWLHTTHNIPNQLAETPSGFGFGWHGMGGVAWGNHPGCPGNLRKPQRQTILSLATSSGGGTPIGPPTPPVTPTPQEVDMWKDCALWKIGDGDAVGKQFIEYPDGRYMGVQNTTESAAYTALGVPTATGDSQGNNLTGAGHLQKLAASPNLGYNNMAGKTAADLPVH